MTPHSRILALLVASMLTVSCAGGPPPVQADTITATPHRPVTPEVADTETPLPTQNVPDPTVEPRATHTFRLIEVTSAPDEVRSGGSPMSERCETELCEQLAADYGFEGIFGYYSPAWVEHIQLAMDAYALMLSQGSLELGRAEFKARVSGIEGFQRVEFVYELQSGRSGAPFARFAPSARDEIDNRHPDVFAVWCPHDHVEGVCAAYDIPPGTILIDVSTNDHRDEIKRTLAHELTHALDTKSQYDARREFEQSGAARFSPVSDTSLQEDFAETIALWLFPRTDITASEWHPQVVSFISNYMVGNMRISK